MSQQYPMDIFRYLSMTIACYRLASFTIISKYVKVDNLFMQLSILNTNGKGTCSFLGIIISNEVMFSQQPLLSQMNLFLKICLARLVTIKLPIKL